MAEGTKMVEALCNDGYWRDIEIDPAVMMIISGIKMHVAMAYDKFGVAYSGRARQQDGIWKFAAVGYPEPTVEAKLRKQWPQSQ